MITFGPLPETNNSCGTYKNKTNKLFSGKTTFLQIELKALKYFPVGKRR